MKKLALSFPAKTAGYDILIGENLLAEAGGLIHERLGKRRCLIVTDGNVAPLYLAKTEDSLHAAGHEVSPSITVPAGEASKSFASLQNLMEAIFARAPDRKTLIVALGGGVVGDLAGFAASIALRGVDFVQIPTTLLAQVDSSVGGKTGIDTSYGKNTLGAFYQPRLVLADVATLNTLPPREVKAGYAEVVKYGLLMDEAFFEWCDANGAKILAGDTAAQIEAVEKSCAFKAKIVEQDEKEAGARALLNLGHTFGHAMEGVSGFGDALLHGEAVGIGCILAFRLSAEMGLCPKEDAARVAAHFEKLGMPLQPPPMAGKIDALMALMAQDKKAEGGALTLILARKIGEAFAAKNVPPQPIRALWEGFLK